MTQKTCGAQHAINIIADPISILAKCLRDRNVEVCGKGIPGVATLLPRWAARAIRCRWECSRISRIALKC